MKKVMLLVIMLVMLTGWVQYAMAESPSQVLLKNVEVTSTADDKKIELKFDGIPNEFVPSYREEFVQIELNDTSVIPPKQWINVKDGFFKNIFVYQFDEKTVRARFYTIGNAANLQEKIKFTNENDSIVLTYSISGGPSAVAVAHNVQGVAKAEHADNNADTHVDTHNDTNADTHSDTGVLAAGVKEDTSGGHLIPKTSDSPGIYGSFIKMLIVLVILIALLLVVLYVVKKFLWKKIGKGGQEDGIRVITSAYVGPKKSIALVEVAGERIVVGITSDNISMLTKVSKDMEFHEVFNEQVSSVADAAIKNMSDTHDDVDVPPSSGSSLSFQNGGKGGFNTAAVENNSNKKVEMNDELWEKA